MNEIVNFNFGAAVVRTVVIHGEPWFVAKDVCNVLDIQQTVTALRNIPDRQKDVINSHTPGGTQRTSIISEAGLYRLVLRSRKPNAEQFVEWVTSEVLPTIRKTGGVYMTPQKTEELLADPDLIIGLAMQVKKLKEDRDKLAEYNHKLSLENQEVKGERDDLKEELGMHGTFRMAKAIPWLKDYFKVRMDGTWQSIGINLKKLSDALEYEVRYVANTDYGKLNLYHVDVIEEFKIQLDADFNLMRKYRRYDRI